MVGIGSVSLIRSLPDESFSDYSGGDSMIGAIPAFLYFAF